MTRPPFTPVSASKSRAQRSRGLGCLFMISIVGAQGGAIVEQFRAADRMGRMRAISDSLLQRIPASESEVRNLLTEALKDPDGSVRAEAVGSIGTILLFASTPTPPAGAEWTVKWRDVAAALRPQLDEALQDPEPRVRREALRGIVAPYANRLTPVGERLPPPLVARLAQLFDTDASALVRAAVLPIVTAAHTSADPEARRLAAQAVLRGLQDSEPSVVQAAARAAGGMRHPDALPVLVKHLQHPSFNVRMVVAQGIAAYRADARRYIPELEAALAAETHDITRKTIAGTISVISK